MTTPRDPAAPHDPADDHTRLVVIHSAIHFAEAGAVKAALEDAGIDARLNGDLLGNAMGDVQFGFRGDYEVWVREPDAATAAAVIAELQARRDEPLGPEADVAGDPDPAL